MKMAATIDTDSSLVITRNAGYCIGKQVYIMHINCCLSSQSEYGGDCSFAIEVSVVRKCENILLVW